MPKYISVLPVLVFTAIFIVGLMNAINPRFIWKLLESWKATSEPTKSYFLMRRVGGIIAMLIAAAMFLYPYFMSKLL